MSSASRRRHRGRAKAVAAPVLALAVWLSGATSWPCSPWFPSSILATDGAVTASPLMGFAEEVRALDVLPATGFEAVNYPHGSASAVNAAEHEELLHAAGRQPLGSGVRAYLSVRDGVLSWQGEVDRWRGELYWRRRDGVSTPRPELPATFTVPSGDDLPAEFALYLEGALAYHRDRPDEARGAWLELLELPPEMRRLRSTWAAFMLGRLVLRQAGDGALDPAAAEEAVRRFRQTRQLAAAGFADRLGLAAESLGWEARVALSDGRTLEAMTLYAEQLAAGALSAGASLDRVCRQLALGEREALREVAAKELRREIFTLWLTSHAGASDDQLAADWAGMLAGAGAETASAGALAWAAYQGGRFDGASRWASVAPEEDGLALWVRAKLLLRAGQLEAALPLLEEAARHRPEYRRVVEGEPGPASSVRASAEAGTVALALGRYPEALDLLARAGYWVDAAYLAERVLTADELRSYVDREWPRELPAEGERSAATAAPRWPNALLGARPPDAWIAWRLRYLLARRLARQGRWREAVPYYRGARLKGEAEEVAAWLGCAGDPYCPAERRTDALWQVAQRLRWRGMELLGSEIDPDWARWGGSFALGTFGLAPGDRADHARWPASADEAERWQRSRPEPYRRYHYRYVAADYAWRAAERMPDGDERTARVLATAGTWIKYGDPEAADRFYKALVRRCGDTALGREADRRRWFPPL